MDSRLWLEVEHPELMKSYERDKGGTPLIVPAPAVAGLRGRLSG